MYSTLVTMVMLTPPVSKPKSVGQLRSYTCTSLWHQEIPSVGGGGVQRNQFSRPFLGLGPLTKEGLH